MGLPSLPLKGETRRRLGEQDRRWRFKLGLRAFATFCALPAFLLFAIANGMSRHYYGGEDWTDGMPLAPILLVLIYNPIHLFFSLSSKYQRSLHPAFPLTIDTLIWALSVPSIVFSVGVGWFWWWTDVSFELETGPNSDDDVIPCFGPNFWTKPCQPMIYTLGKMEIAASVFLGLILITHFILFVYSCIAAHRHRLARAGRSRNVELRHRTPSEIESHPQPDVQHHSQPPAYTPSSHPSNTGSSVTHGGVPAGMQSQHTLPTETRGGIDSPYMEPVSPINSGSGGGFGGTVISGFTGEPEQKQQHHHHHQQTSEHREDHLPPHEPGSPFGDRFEAKFA